MTQPIQHINPPELGDPSHYGFTNIVTVPTSQTLIFIAGQGGADEEGNYGNFETQLKRVFSRLRTALATIGATPDQVVKITLLSVNHNAEQQRLISAERNAMWPNALLKPTSTLIPVPRLASDGMLFEMDSIAAMPAD